MALQTFTAGQVLTAAQVTALQTNDFNQSVSAKTASHVLVAADKGTRVEMNSASATTITVNTSLFNAGDTLFIQNIGAGACTITAGTATVATAGSLALAQNAGGTLYFTSAGVSIFFSTSVASASGLVLIKTQTIGSAVSSVTVTGAFSATYDNYKILISGGVASADVGGSVKLGVTAAGYYVAARGLSYAGVASDNNTNNGASFAGIVAANTSVISGNFELQNPFATKVTVLSFAFTNPTSGAQSRNGGGFLDNTTSYTDFTITPSSGTYTGGTIFVYGYVK